MNTIYDLSGLGLSIGDHNIYVVGKAPNYKDSDPSNTVVYSILPNIVISGLKASYRIGEEVAGISAIVEQTQEAVDYTINGEDVTSYIPTKEDLENGVVVSATFGGVTATATAEVVNEVEVGDFDTLTAAVNAVGYEGLVKLSEDLDLADSAVEIGEGVKITLDLNGFSIAGVNNGDIYVTGGDLTLIDSDENSTGSIYANSDYGTGHGSGLIAVREGVFTMNSGKIYAVRDDAVNKGQFGITYGGITTAATVNINGGTITAGWYAVSSAGNFLPGSVLNITGGTLVSTVDYAIYGPSNGIINVSGDATIVDGGAGAVCINNGTINITGGNFASKGNGDTGTWENGTGGLGDVAVYLNARYGNSTANISGGLFVAERSAVDLKTGSAHTATFNITGGVYSDDPSAFLTEGYTAVERADGKFEVVPAA